MMGRYFQKRRLVVYINIIKNSSSGREDLKTCDPFSTGWSDENKLLWWSNGKKRLHQNGPRNNQNIRPENYMFCVSKIYKLFFQCEKKAQWTIFIWSWNTIFFCINFCCTKTEILHMKKLPNSLKYLQENDEIQEKFAKDISQKYICTMVELKNVTKIKQLTLTTTMKLLSTSQL